MKDGCWLHLISVDPLFVFLLSDSSKDMQSSIPYCRTIRDRVVNIEEVVNLNTLDEDVMR